MAGMPELQEQIPAVAMDGRNAACRRSRRLQALPTSLLGGKNPGKVMDG
jgi:hypothetical protein